MIIKRLELQGFKTFPERTRLVFDQGITIIIGPNGTGKSNIVEAVQWVLGGQRVRSVRGEKTEDAIFTGTSRRPAMGMADVTLVLQNGDDEMHINHRVFRTGESEYRLDGKVVRLKDIQDELWKKSISENRYFVIEQGAIGTFVTSKPTEKRALIEEAAGTAYYKDKKRQAENKLAGSELNLVRLEDIIAEVAKARNSLARQASAAEKYRQLRERIRELAGLNFRRKSEQLDSERKGVQERYASSLDVERETLARLNAEEKSVNRWRKEAGDLEQSLKESQENLFSQKSQIARLEAERERESRRIEFFEEKRKKAASDHDDFLAELLLLDRDIHAGRDDLEASARLHAQKRTEAVDLESAHRATEEQNPPWTERVQACRSEIVLKLAELTEARNEGARLEKELELVRRQAEKIRERKTEAQKQLEEKRKDIADREARLVQAEREIQNKEAARAGLQSALLEVSAAIETDRESLRALKEKRDEDAYHLQALRKLEEKERAAEPLYDAQGALGPFTELLESDPADAPLVDVFWKDEARATVISVEELLKNLGVRELKGHFLLLSEHPQDKAPEAAVLDPAVLGLLAARLRPNAKLEGRMPRLEDAVIVKDIESGIRLWLRFPSLNFVSIQGDALYSTGLLKLGRRAEGLFTMSQEAKELEKKISRRNAEIDPVASRLDCAVLEKQELEARIAAESASVEALQKAGVEEEKGLALGRAEKEGLDSDLALFAHELEVLGLDEAGLLAKAEHHAQDIRRLTGEEADLRSRAESEEKEFLLHQEKSAREAARLLELRGASDVLTEKMSGLELSLKSLTLRRETITAKMDTLQEEIRTSQAEEARLKELVSELGQKTVEGETRRSELGRQLLAGEARRGEIQTALSESEARLAELRPNYDQKKDERMKWEVRKAEIDRDLVNLEEACWQELKKNLQEVKAESLTGEAAEGDVEAELEECRDRLQKYGAVNLMAEEEYQEQKSRHEFLTRQKKDLTDSIAQTKEAIVKIDEESRQRFIAAMSEVNKNFQDLFGLLFKGGSAEVKLVDESDPLESGVEVIAQPPGKKVQNMGLLSGGEKSLTSLAFLFALFRYKPTPFCILDEVDAALDEANLARFLDLMNVIKTETQFIIITHNYKTMEVADYIYGTTMEEPNVTKVFSMKLEKKGNSQDTGS
jgi:chromosome segregation protein